MDHHRYGGFPIQPEAALYQILEEAQHRWLRPMEVCEILRNYHKFKLTPEPPHKPQSGSLFLFDRKALRYFRKDGHNWRKKKDGKTVREAHERLKAGSVEVLHCYYAHGEEKENFQRRSYWMLDTNEHIVLVHYREVKEGSRSGTRSPNSSSAVGAGCSPQTSPLVSPRSSSPNTSADWNGLTYSPECDEPESSDDTDQYCVREIEHNRSNGINGVSGVAVASARGFQSSTSFSTVHQNGGSYDEKFSAPPHKNVDGTAAALYQAVSGIDEAQVIRSKQENGVVTPPGELDLLEWCEVLKQSKSWGGKESSGISDMGLPCWPDQTREKAMMAASYRLKDSTKVTISEGMESIQAPLGHPLPAAEAHLQGFPDTQSNPMNNFHPFDVDELSLVQVVNKHSSNMTPWSAVLTQLGDNGRAQSGLFEGFDSDILNEPQQSLLQFPHTYLDADQPYMSQHDLGRFDMSLADNNDSSLVHSYPNVFRDFQADTPTQHEHDTFQKYDSFGRWMSQEIGGDVENSMIPVSSDSTYWASALAEEFPGLKQQMHLDIGLIPSLSHEKCFVISEYSPNNALSTSDTKILVTGTFGDMVKDPSEFKWCCMFGDVEVPAELLQPGVLRCNAPSHAPGKVPFYITRNDRIACSEVREFEYRAESNSSSSAEAPEGAPLNKRDMLFQIRLARMLSYGSSSSSSSQMSKPDEATRDLPGDLNSLVLFEEWEQMEDQLTESGCLATNLKEQLIQKLLKEKLQLWLWKKVLEGGKGAAVLDDNGLGVLHMGAALGYAWIIVPMLAAGVNINFRDSRGWTALHWAAYYGREVMVVELLASGAAPGAKTDPTNAFPAGRTPADLASAEQHKGIAGYLAESLLTSHLQSLTLKSKSNENNFAADDAVETVSERTVVQPTSVGESEEQLSLQDSLAAVRNAAQAAARIQSAFRVQSFRKKQESYRLEEDEYGISNEEAQYIVAAQKSNKSGSIYEDDVVTHSAAIRIQQKYRGWKGRREFLMFRQHVVKIQAHVRGHQVRKQYNKILWSVSIVEKAILRWRRRGKGLRGFESSKVRLAVAVDEKDASDRDDDFLKAGRKQIEVGLEKALARVQSMARSPEAREQYRRLLEGYQKTKVHLERVAYDTEDKEPPLYSEDFAMSTYP